MTALRRQRRTTVATSPSPQDTRDLLILACALRKRGRHLLVRPDALRARARRQLIELREPRARDCVTMMTIERDTVAALNPYRRDPAQTELLATLSTLQRAITITTALRPRIEELIDEIDDLIVMSSRAARPLRMRFSPRASRDAAQVTAGHLRRFMLALSTLRLADEIRRRSAELDSWRPDEQSLWQDYQAHATSYEELLS